MNQPTLNIIFLSLPYLQQGDSSKRSFHTLFYYVYIKWGMRDSLRYMFLVFIRPRDAHVLVTAAVTFDISNYPAKHSIMKVEYHFIILMSLTLKRKNKLHAILCSRRTFVLCCSESNGCSIECAEQAWHTYATAKHTSRTALTPSSLTSSPCRCVGCGAHNSHQIHKT